MRQRINQHDRTGLRLPLVRVLPDGTLLSMLVSSKFRYARREGLIAAAREGGDLDLAQACLVRIMEYDVPDRDGTELIAPVTSYLEPTDARADQLAAAYHRRRAEETGNDQVKIHMHGSDRVLRSRLPDLVRQEVWAYLLTHHAISSLITRAAVTADTDPDRVGFARALNICRRTAIFGTPHIRAPHLLGQAMQTLTL